MPDDRFHIYDTTLRDGAQQQGLSLTVGDKLAIARSLDTLGVGFIEGGWPGAIPKDTEFFRRARGELELTHAQLAAFGSTRRPGRRVTDDPLVLALRDAQAPVVTLVAKSHDRHVELALKTTLCENLAMIAETVEFLRAGGQRVFLDAEHFFDGYRSNPGYALEVVRTAMEAGADLVALCDTNGGMLPDQIAETVAAVLGTGARLGVHCHDDSACGVANTLAAVDAGVTHVQGTANGYGERAGNANLFSVVAGLQLKKGFQLVSGERLGEMSRIAHEISRIVNVPPDSHQPYVGASAFAHKAGLHASAVKVDPMLYQHIDPLVVGNDMKMIISDMAGRASVELKGRELGIDVTSDRAVIGRVAEQVKDMEARGYTFESADASFELLLRTALGEQHEYFTVKSWRVTVERGTDGVVTSQATVKVTAQGSTAVAAGEGDSPVRALDNALRAALERTYPELASLTRTEYRARVLEAPNTVTRVVLECGEGDCVWNTVGVDEDIIAASWEALEQAVTYCLLRSGRSAAATTTATAPVAYLVSAG
ncbi:MAG TPA: citramalate synthase [Streptosporangiaceae bacterium]|jgi:2-isopropylmalate synthase